MRELIQQVQRLAELLGPNAYLQAVVIALAFIIFGKVADWFLSRMIGRIGVWYNMFRNFATLAVQVGERRTGSKFVGSGMLQLLQNVIMVILFALAVYFVFIAWNIEVTAWLASAGIVGLALSFAAKDTLSNLFAGVSIVADAPYKHGDFILLCWIERPVNRGRLQHELNCAVYRAFAANEIEIAFPQRDLHVRTMAPASGSTE